MYGCPSLKKLAECEPLAKEGAAVYGNMSWCKTTYDTCQSQVDYPNDVTGETEMMVRTAGVACHPAHTLLSLRLSPFLSMSLCALHTHIILSFPSRAQTHK